MNWLIKWLGIDELFERVNTLETDVSLLIEELGEVATYCDKCDGRNAIVQCFKCNGTGLVKRKQLITWPW